MERLFFRVREAAEALGLSRAKTYELVLTGKLASVKIDGARRIPAAALRAFVDGLTTQAETEEPR